MKAMPLIEYHLRTLVSHLFSGLSGVLIAWASFADLSLLWWLGLFAAIAGKVLADKLALDLIGADEL